MEWLTGLVTFAGIVGVLASPPQRGLLVYVVVVLLYPDYMRIDLGGAEINPHRVMITVLLIKCLCTTSVRQRLRWNGLDTAMVLSVTVYAAALSFTTPLDYWLKNRSGDLMDTLFVYLAFRLVVTDRVTLLSLAKTVAILLVPLAALAVCEALWGWNPYWTLANTSAHAPHGPVYDVRHGLNRAGGPWVSSIMFGLTFSSFLPLIWLLRLQPISWRSASYALCAAAAIGTLSTLSSGPYMMLMIVVFCLWLERHKAVVRPILIALVCGCLVIEIVSNRHFYDVLSDLLAMDTGNAWYRSQLMRFAWEKLPEYWTVGYGLTDCGWGMLIDERNWTDSCNDYVLHLSDYGVFGFLAFVGVLVAAMRVTIRAYHGTRDPWLRSLCWALGAIMTGLMASFFTVSVFKIMVTVFYIVLALQGAVYQMQLSTQDAALRVRRHRPRWRAPVPMARG